MMAPVSHSSTSPSSMNIFYRHQLEETATATTFSPGHLHKVEAVEDDNEETAALKPLVGKGTTKKKVKKVLRSILTTVTLHTKHPSSYRPPFGKKVVGTLFGYRKGRAHLAFQTEPTALPSLILELDMPTCGMVGEMASGLVRIALECEGSVKKVALVEEKVWRAYCNGRKCGYAVATECTVGDAGVLRAVSHISMGAGLLPGSDHERDVLYMRARFERVVGSRDSESFYMMGADESGGPELSVFLLRV